MKALIGTQAAAAASVVRQKSVMPLGLGQIPILPDWLLEADDAGDNASD
ncbi:hypothetical protein [Methylobacterium sp. CM6246]